MGKESEQSSTESSKKEPVDYAAASANGYRIYEIGDGGDVIHGICWKEYGNLKRLSEICELNPPGQCGPYCGRAEAGSAVNFGTFSPVKMYQNLKNFEKLSAGPRLVPPAK